MAIAIRSITTDIGTQDPISVVTPSDTEVGDLLVIITANDFYALSNIQTPTVTGSPTVNAIPDATADAGTNAAHIKAWWAVANTAGANTITENETGSADEDKILAVYVLTGADTTTPIDIADSAFGSSSTSHVCPSVDPNEIDSFLICHASSGGGAATTSHTTPGTLTERYDLSEGGISGVGGTQQLASGDATGTRTFTAASSVPWAAMIVAIRTAAGGAIEEPVNTAAETDAAQALAKSKTRTAGAAAETDAAQTLARAKARAVGPAATADAAVAVAAGKVRAIGTAVDASASQAIVGAKARAVGVASTTTAALALAKSKTAAIGVATATDEALPISPTGSLLIGTTLETSAAQGLGRVKAKTLGVATETTAARSLAGETASPAGTMTAFAASASSMRPVAAAASSMTPVAAGGPTMRGA